MLGSNVLDIIIGILVLFTLLGICVTTLTEVFQTFIQKVRSKHLNYVLRLLLVGRLDARSAEYEAVHYLTDKGEVRNPLSLGQPMYSAAYVQMAYGAANIDLAPSASQNTVAPEHFWTLAKHLQSLSLYRDPSTDELQQRPLKIWTCIRDPHCTITGESQTVARSVPTLERLLEG